jgi:hypothetical protein
MARPMTAAEKQRFQQYFPGLNVNAAVVTDNATAVYNCISWTVGVTNRWLWPGNTLAVFDTFYAGFGFVRSGNGPIAAWGHSTTNMTHGSVSGAGHGPRWESKCGSDLRIQHGLGELAGSNYGRVIAFYRARTSLAAANARLVEEIMNEKAVKSYMSPAQRKALAKEHEQVSAAVRADYNARFEAWKKTWFAGGLAFNSNPHMRAVGPEYDALVGMGPVILPLVIESLADPENFMALQLYDALQSDDRLLVQFEPEDERLLEGEQGRARRVVQAWFVNR